MTTTPQGNELTDRLHRVTDPIESPLAPDELVRLGRAAVRRRRGRAVAAALSVAVLAVGVGGGVALLGDQDGRRASTRAADQPSSTAPSTTAPTAASPSCTISSARHSTPPRGYKTLASYRAILVAHLDPGGQHLGKVDNVQGSDDGCSTVYGLGSKFGWSSPGISGLGLVQIEVNRGWRDSQIHLAHDGWRPAGKVPAGAVRAFVVEYDGGLAVAVTRPDGITVALDVNSLFGNNSTVPTSGMDFTVEQLLQTATDPGFQLPRDGRAPSTRVIPRVTVKARDGAE
jgi:hypothetical protein